MQKAVCAVGSVPVAATARSVDSLCGIFDGTKRVQIMAFIAEPAIQGLARRVLRMLCGSSEVELYAVDAGLFVRAFRREFSAMIDRECLGVDDLKDVLLVRFKDLPCLRAWIPGKSHVLLTSRRATLMAVRGGAADVLVRTRASLICEAGELDRAGEGKGPDVSDE